MLKCTECFILLNKQDISLRRNNNIIIPFRFVCHLANDTNYIAAMEQQNHFRRHPPSNTYKLPGVAVVERASRRLIKERQLWRTLHETAIGLLLLVLVLIIAHGSVDRRSFYVNKSIRDIFIKTRHSGAPAFTEVSFIRLCCTAPTVKLHVCNQSA